MNLSRFLVFNFSLPAFEFSKGLSIRSNYLDLSSLALTPKEKIIKLQTQKLRKLIEYAFKNVPYYRDRFYDLKINPSDIKNTQDIVKLPLLTRDDIQHHGERMVSETVDRRKCYSGSSSGSTGAPVVYWRDKPGSSMSQATHYFGWSLSGWHFGDHYLTVWGNVTTVKRDWARLSSRIKSKIFRETKIPAFSLVDPSEFEKLYDICRAGRFRYIQGYTNAIYAFSEYLMEKGRSLDCIKAVLTTAESLQPHQRETISNVLGPVFDCYGCGEINSIAFQCSKGNYHVMDPHVIVEYGRETDDHGNRELYITDLDNYAMPLIRYANGDMGRPGSAGACPCGLPFSVMGGVSGRISDIIRTPDGGILSVPSFFGSRLLKNLSSIVRYRVDLLVRNELVINIQLRRALTKEEDKIINDALNEYIPATMKWSLKFVKKINPDNNGKYKLIVDMTTADPDKYNRQIVF